MTKLIHICGAGRSGSTLLEMVLANSPRALSIGATRLLWRLGFEDNLLLPSGQRFLEDPMWSQVAEALGPDLPADIFRDLNRYVRQRSLPALIARAATGLEEPGLRKLRERLSFAFGEIARRSGREFLIESSSTAAYTVLLNNLPGVTVFNIHLLRHPRAVSYSWARPKPQPETEGRSQMVVRSQRRSDADWLSTNLGIIVAQRAGTLGPLVRVSYEDLCNRTAELLRRVDTMIGDEVFSGLDLDALVSKQTKGVGGNPIRFQEGPLAIRYDERWREGRDAGVRSWTDRVYDLASRA